MSTCTYSKLVITYRHTTRRGSYTSSSVVCFGVASNRARLPTLSASAVVVTHAGQYFSMHVIQTAFK
eukprot:m.157838 g.157838  ORF g.157838 m.157838 type:complete len:67 (+) comp17977_c0_seq2:356-556(+)